MSTDKIETTDLIEVSDEQPPPVNSTGSCLAGMVHLREEGHGSFEETARAYLLGMCGACTGGALRGRADNFVYPAKLG